MQHSGQWEIVCLWLMLLLLHVALKSILPLDLKVPLKQNQKCSLLGGGRKSCWRGFGVFPSTCCACPASLFWNIHLIESIAPCPPDPWDTSKHQAGWQRLCVFPGKHSPLHPDCNTIFPVWGFGYYSEKLWKSLLSFIVPRLKSFLTTSTESKRHSGCWQVS